MQVRETPGEDAQPAWAAHSDRGWGPQPRDAGKSPAGPHPDFSALTRL